MENNEEKIKELEYKIKAYEEYIENSKIYINQMDFNILVHQLLLLILEKLEKYETK